MTKDNTKIVRPTYLADPAEILKAVILLAFFGFIMLSWLTMLVVRDVSKMTAQMFIGFGVCVLIVLSIIVATAYWIPHLIEEIHHPGSFLSLSAGEG